MGLNFDSFRLPRVLSVTMKYTILVLTVLACACAYAFAEEDFSQGFNKAAATATGTGGMGPSPGTNPWWYVLWISVGLVIAAAIVGVIGVIGYVYWNKTRGGYDAI